MERYIGQYPAIGIRPVIDARRGPMKLRESLEEQTMAMALSAKKLFEENLRYSNGAPVRVVIADGSIGRVPETAACADKFRRDESYIEAGCQKIGEGIYGKSITDPCLGWEDSRRLIYDIADTCCL